MTRNGHHLNSHYPKRQSYERPSPIINHPQTQAPITLSTLNKLKAEGKTFSAYLLRGKAFAHAMQLADIDTILIGDSLGMVVQGQSSTLPVGVQDMVYHTQNVVRGNLMP